jgi:hypothetical protein
MRHQFDLLKGALANVVPQQHIFPSKIAYGLLTASASHFSTPGRIAR